MSIVFINLWPFAMRSLCPLEEEMSREGREHYLKRKRRERNLKWENEMPVQKARCSYSLMSWDREWRLTERGCREREGNERSRMKRNNAAFFEEKRELKWRRRRENDEAEMKMKIWNREEEKGRREIREASNNEMKREKRNEEKAGRNEEEPWSEKWNEKKEDMKMWLEMNLEKIWKCRNMAKTKKNIEMRRRNLIGENVWQLKAINAERNTKISV